ncbi:MAG: class I SAM-dependent methyltransferase [Pseudomonadota bacterium]
MTDTQNPRPCPVCAQPFDHGGNAFTCASCGLELQDSGKGIYLAGTGESLNYPEDAADLTSQVEETSFWFAHRNRVLGDLVAQFPVDGPIWDVGGGNGFQALYFQSLGHPAVLVEPGIAGCMTGARRGLDAVICGTLEQLQLGNDQLAGICMLDVLEHLPDPAGLLTESFRVLRPGGQVFITVPAFEFLWSDEDDYAHHHRRYTSATLGDSLLQAGFEIQFLSYYFQSLVLPILLLRTAPFRLRAMLGRKRELTMDQSEHAPGGIAQKVVDTLLNGERRKLRDRRRLGFGSSVIAVCKKPI